ncbi:MAG: cyclic nucleotide-binding domain-containing protein [Candidatus Marinimicrobia bacterium]|jgi:CRP-like cAMP-binding protein|nr:cyclic nucleotide-binding domain-containing protein [Candidatus Neomarinimicrobiota bacterium]|tara:strand:- start:391 stop:897 length:507 start_codon:yes stop_codon:yes gene_type:complete
MENIKNLGDFRVFSDLSEDQLNKFQKKVEIREFKAGTTIFEEGDVGDSLYLLLDGEVEINQALTMQLSKGDYDTREKSIIRLSSDISPCFGEMSLLGNDDKRTAGVRAISDCKMAVIMKDDLFSICTENPELGYIVMRNVAAIVTDNLIKANQNVLKLTTAFSLILEK